MGDRISINFKKEEGESITLFSHWDGRELLTSVKDYYSELKAILLSRKERFELSEPIDRLEPNTVMVDFIRWLTEGTLVKGNYYLGANENDGGNSDNGHFTFNLDIGEFEDGRWIKRK